MCGGEATALGADAEDAAESVGGVFVVADGDGVDAHLDDWVIVAAGLGHIAEVEDVGFFDFELFHEVRHAEDFVHAWGDGVDRGGATDLVLKFGGDFFGAFDDGLTLFAIGVPSVLGLGASGLAEGREGDLAEAVFDDFVARGELVSLPVAELGRGLLDGLSDFGDLCVGKWVVVNLLPSLLGGIVAIILGALGDEEMQVAELFWRGAVFAEPVNNLDEELLVFLAGNGADFVVVEAADEEFSDFVGDGHLGDV